MSETNLKEEVLGDIDNYGGRPYVEVTDQEYEEVRVMDQQLSNPKKFNADTFEYLDRNLVGFSGEVAFAKHYGLDYEFDPLRPETSYDFEVCWSPIPTSEMWRTVRIDVKTTDYPGGHLLIQDSVDITSDIYFLITQHGKDYVFCGWVRDCTVLDAPVHEYTHTKAKTIPQSDLNSAPPESVVTDSGGSFR